MGSLYHTAWNVKELKEEYGLKMAVETGTAHGDGTRYLVSFFEKVFTIEINSELFDANLDSFSKHPNIYKYLGKTVDNLPGILELNKDTPTFFWLDAHLPQGEGHSEEVYLPLEEELRVIKKNKDTSKDVLLIDDLRIYEDGPFQAGNWVKRHDYSNTAEGVNFVRELFAETHSIEKSYKDEGYLLLSPLSK